MNDDSLDVLDRAAALRRAGMPFALCTVTHSQRPTSARAGAKAVVTVDGAIFGWVGGACSQPSVIRHAREAIENGEPKTIRLSPDGGTGRDGVVELAMTCHSGGTLEVFIEPFQPEPSLVVVGDTPVTRSLLTIGHQLGYHTVAMASPASDADQYDTGLTFGALSPNRAAYIVVASMGVVDEEALLGALRLEPAPAYVALVGSRRRFASIADYLRHEGIAEERIATVHAPAGLDIRAETPAEIALSILGQITEVRRTTPYRLPQPVTAVPAQIVIDPICGMEVDLATAKHTLVVDGETFGFCCPACKREYERQLRESSPLLS
ncbi:MAG TPA: XdhC family protein [Thermomicrobiales bacterium]|nr:XdhC family protein [Thermomicrobiales bacterium]